ncbi:hypothetical protein CLRAG_33750 [Clostridium ragsdalei P11]|uniref:DUF4062 domain-containing protein n=1 Tax=Clostridium ragsdalei P11 TaxID=1353534 RepID=A0A1A6AKW6_9CLOT|nr:DUF4062 domain-containing protein [Clostridium ragsdalei]OBR90727.1 hypothetical protein CLRAG_33750 [Clostridium ragsdalei P11]
MTKKKLQIFISSTYIDLQEERQAAVEAILGSKHIPAGMELFRAGNVSQLETIKKWINESDIYMLILGGRYGSIESSSGKSYTEIEYRYAIDKKIPVFAVVLTESFLHKKAANGLDVFEKDNKDKYNNFKEFVMTKIVKQVDDCKDIKLAIKDSITELEEQYNLYGWVKGSEIDDNTEIIKENSKLLKENNKLKGQLQKLKEKDKIGNFEYEKLKKVLSKKTLTISKNFFEDSKKDKTMTYLHFFKIFKNIFVTGFTNCPGIDKLQSYIFNDISPFLIEFGLLEINRVPGTKYEKIHMSKNGLNFIARLELEDVNN